MEDLPYGAETTQSDYRLLNKSVHHYELTCTHPLCGPCNSTHRTAHVQA